MFSRIVAVVMCIVTAFVAPFSQIFSETELKSELAKGFYESPYIVRPLDGITVNGASVEEYSVVGAQDDLCSNAVQTLCNEIYKACGKRVTPPKKPTEKLL
jgi:hypothetical protein